MADARGSSEARYWPEVFPGWDWADLRWCMYCDEVRGEGAMQFTEDNRYICRVCLSDLEMRCS